MKHYGLDLEVGFKHQIMQQSVKFSGFCFDTYLKAQTLFVWFLFYLQSFSFLVFLPVIPLQAHKYWAVDIIYGLRKFLYPC